MRTSGSPKRAAPRLAVHLPPCVWNQLILIHKDVRGIAAPQIRHPTLDSKSEKSHHHRGPLVLARSKLDCYYGISTSEKTPTQPQGAGFVAWASSGDSHWNEYLQYQLCGGTRTQLGRLGVCQVWATPSPRGSCARSLSRARCSFPPTPVASYSGFPTDAGSLRSRTRVQLCAPHVYTKPLPFPPPQAPETWTLDC